MSSAEASAIEQMLLKGILGRLERIERRLDVLEAVAKQQGYNVGTAMTWSPDASVAMLGDVD